MSWGGRSQEPAEEARGYSMADFATRWERIEAEGTTLIGPSIAERIALLELERPGVVDELLELVGPHGWEHLAHDLAFLWLRPKQQAALVALTEIILFVGGRGMGKTQTGAGWVIDRMERGAREVVLVGPTDDEIEQYMLGGHKCAADGDLSGSGLLDRMPPWMHVTRDKKSGTLEVRHETGRATMVRTFSAHSAEFRGPNPDTVWGDESIKWRFAKRLISNLRLACRAKGKIEPQMLLTTSPKPRAFLRDLVMDPEVTVVHGTTRENRGNVTDRWIDAQHRRLDGTRQGAEELEGRLLGDDGSGVFSVASIDEARVDEAPAPLDLVVVSIDPSASQHVKADMTGLVVVGRKGHVDDGHAFVLDDATDRYAWDAWGDRSYVLAETHGASAFVCERNKYADAVAANLRTAGSRRGYEPRPRPGCKHLFDMVHTRTGKRIQIIEVGAMYSKADRAGPVSTLYEQHRVHHVGHFARLETEMTEYDSMSSQSPNAMDALVHGVTEVFGLDRAPKADAREGFRGLAESLSGAGQQAQRAEPAQLTPAQPGGSLASMLAHLQRGHWGSRI